MGKFFAFVYGLVAYLIFFFTFLYAVGFVIMNSFLGKYGVRAGAVFTFDYIAAALCYIIFVGAVAGPVWVLYYGMIRSHTLGSPAKWVWATIILWIALLTIFRQLYFPGGEISRFWTQVQALVILIGIAHWIFKKRLSKKKPAWADKWLPILKHELVLPSYLVILGLIGVVGEQHADGWFIFEAFFLFGTLITLAGTATPLWELKEHLSRWEIQSLLAIFFVCVVLVNASQFGQKQYGLLPTLVGGGQPNGVLIKTQLATEENAKRAGLPVGDGMIGPVLLLYQSTSEVCVISEDNYTKDSGGAVQLKRDLIDWIATRRQEKNAKPSVAPSPALKHEAKPTASPSVAPTESIIPAPISTPTNSPTNEQVREFRTDL